MGYPKLGSQCKDKLFYGGGRSRKFMKIRPPGGAAWREDMISMVASEALKNLLTERKREPEPAHK